MQARKPGKITGFLSAVYFRMGKMLFPVVEPLFILVENFRPDVRKHFELAIKSLESNNTPVALLNLNMVLSLRQNHFLARVYRGKIFLREGQYRLAGTDLVRANRINSYRFTHYNLYNDYLAAVEGEGKGNEKPTVRHSDQSFESSIQDLEQASLDREGEEGTKASETFPDFEEYFEEDEYLLEEDLNLPKVELEKFEAMGPITKDEVDDTNWDNVIRKLTS